MEIDKNLFIIAGLITICLFGLIYVANVLLDYQRESKLNDLRDEVIDELENMKAFTAISSLLGEQENCDILQTQLKYLDKSIWDLGMKLDSYEEASRNIFSNPYYEKQKKLFVVNEILYLSVLEKMKQTCNTTKPVTILYFYANAADCRSCDDQSFVLTDINKEAKQEIAVFSLDLDLEVIGTSVLAEYYKLDKQELPCTVINGKPKCGLRDKSAVISEICLFNNITLCNTIFS
jgi:hypothetical protein